MIHNYKLWLLLALGAYALYELLTLEPEQREEEQEEWFI